jgi:hypothetical protein
MERQDRNAMKLAIIEVLDRDGHTRQSVPVWQWPVTIGRAIECDVVLDDAHLAPVHATITEADGLLTVEAGDSVNGAVIDRRKLSTGQKAELRAGDVLQVGATRLRVRRAADALAPERALAPEVLVGRLRVLLLALAFVAWNLAEFWLNSDPGSQLPEYVVVLIGIPAAYFIWIGLWSAGSRLIRHRFDFWSHARVAFGFSLVASVVELLLPLAGYSSGWVVFSRIASITGVAIIWAMLFAHLRLILPRRPRVLAAVMTVLFLGGVAVYMTRTYQQHDRLFDELYATMLAPPVLRLAPSATAEKFIEESRMLKARVDAHTSDDDQDEFGGR